MARNDIINTDGTIKWDTVGGFKDSIDGHTAQLADIMQHSQYGSYVINVGQYPRFSVETNDTGRVQRAVADLAQYPDNATGDSHQYDSGGILFYPAGDWIQDEISFPMGTEIIGEGWWNTRISPATSGKSAFKVYKTNTTNDNRNGHASRFTGLCLWGGTYSGNLDTDTPIIDYDSLTSIVIEKCWLNSNYGARLSNCADVKLVDNFYDQSTSCVYLKNVTTVYIDRSLFYKHTRQSLVISGCTNVMIGKLIFESHEGQCLNISGSSKVTIEELQFIFDTSNVWSSCYGLNISNTNDVLIGKIILDGKSNAYNMVSFDTITNLVISELDTMNYYAGMILNNITNLALDKVFIKGMVTNALRATNVNGFIEKLFASNLNGGARTDNNEGASIYSNNSNLQVLNSKIDGANCVVGVNANTSSTVTFKNTSFPNTSTIEFADGTSTIYRERKVLYASTAPTTGTWEQGDRIINKAPTVGQPKAWTCTVSGTPGTWVSEGNL